jgi:hypothetical protein
VRDEDQGRRDEDRILHHEFAAGGQHQGVALGEHGVRSHHKGRKRSRQMQGHDQQRQANEDPCHEHRPEEHFPCAERDHNQLVIAERQGFGDQSGHG